MAEIEHRTVTVGGLNVHVAEAGRGPLVVLLHGFPESWYSWRHQLTALAEAGYRAVAPDQRGYGRTDAPADVADYTVLHLVGDVIGLVDALGEPTAAVVGHDWGALVAWSTALLRPDRVRAVASLSVPYRPAGPRPPIEMMRAGLGDQYYMVHFQRPGVADAELNADPRRSLLTILSGLSATAAPSVMVPAGGGFLDALAQPDTPVAWLTEADLDAFTADYARTGFTGGLNWYRNLDRNWALTAAWRDAKVTPPALFVAGEQDVVIARPQVREGLAGMVEHVPNLRRSVLLPDCGHWTQQERPAEVNAELVEFLSHT